MGDVVESEGGGGGRRKGRSLEDFVTALPDGVIVAFLHIRHNSEKIQKYRYVP